MSPLHIEIEGSGPPLVLLHGWGLNLRVWDALRPALAADHTVYAIDLPGHGRSTLDAPRTSLAEQVARIAGSVPEHSTVVGWSLGGQLALELALDHAPRVSSLVLVCTTPRFVAGADWPHGLAADVVDGFAAALGRDYHRTVSDFLDLQVRGSSDPDRVLRQLRGALFNHGEASPEALAAGLAILRGTDLRQRVRELADLAALVVSGQYDRVTPPGAARALADGLPGAELLEMRRAGHAPFLSHTNQFVERLRAFLDTREAAHA